jgi:hypothetical protein
LKPIFTSGGGQKPVQDKSLWNKEGMRYFRSAKEKWKEIYDSEEDMKILYNGWEEWILSKGKEIKVGDGTRIWEHGMMRKLWSRRRELTRVRMKMALELEVGILLIKGVVDIMALGRQES